MIRRQQNDFFFFYINEPRRTIQVVAGPRQVGKTTMVKQVLKEIAVPSMFFNADGVAPDDNTWIATCWEGARAQMRFGQSQEFLIVFDEILKTMYFHSLRRTLHHHCSRFSMWILSCEKLNYLDFREVEDSYFTG